MQNLIELNCSVCFPASRIMARYMVGIPGKRVGWYSRMVFKTPGGLKFGKSTIVAAARIERFMPTVKPYEWKNGATHNVTSLAVRTFGDQLRVCIALASRLRWV